MRWPLAHALGHAAGTIAELQALETHMILGALAKRPREAV